MNAPLPPDTMGNRAALIELEKQSFEIAYESALEAVADGRTLSSFCNGYHSPLSPTRFRTWIFSDRKRRQAYEVAKAIGAEAIEDELIRISDGKDADGNPSADDVPRSQLRVGTRKWLLTVWNREKYGEVKRVEQKIDTTTTDLSSISAQQLNAKVIELLGIELDE